MAGEKLLLTEIDIRHRLKSCVDTLEKNWYLGQSAYPFVAECLAGKF